MEAAAKKYETFQPCLEYGTVRKARDRYYSVDTGFGTIEAERAAGCIVNPAQGDTVLLCLDTAGGAFILSVLRKGAGQGGTELLLNGDVDLRIRGGRLSVVSDDEMSIASRRKISLASHRISMHADLGVAVIEKLSFLGKSFKGEVKRIRMVAVSVEHIFQRLTQRLRDMFCFVKDQQEVQAGSARYLTEETLTMQSKNAVHMAEEIVTINAEQIHMG